MGLLDFWRYHNASWEGDPRWAAASPFTHRAPFVVLAIFFLSLLETVLGAIWISKLSSDMTVPKIIQPLILPGLSVFNAVPSLSLHIFLRSNPPLLALWFSSIYTLFWLVSTLLYLITCNISPADSVPLSLRKVECSTSVRGVIYGPSKALWWIVVIFGWVFVMLHGSHAAMAWYVRRAEWRKRTRDLMENGGVEVVKQTTVTEQELARERWKAIQEL